MGAAAKIYRVKIPLAEISLSYKLESSPTGSPRIQAKVEEFNPGANAEVLAIADDENKGVSLSRFSAGVVMGAMGGRLRTQSLELTLDQLKLPGVAVRSISPLDPSGWVRVALSRTSDSAPMVAGARERGEMRPARASFSGAVARFCIPTDRLAANPIAVIPRIVSHAVPATADRRTGERDEDRRRRRRRVAR